jgi:hypothetical protein
MMLRLALSTAGMAASTIACWYAWTLQPSPLPRRPAMEQEHASQTAPMPSARPAPVTATWSTSLFHFPQVVEAVPEPSAAEAPAFLIPPIRLLGIIEVDGVSIALIQPQEGAQPMRVRKGTTVGVWQVVQLERRAIILQNEMQSLRFEIGRSTPMIASSPPDEQEPEPQSSIRTIPLIEGEPQSR